MFGSRGSRAIVRPLAAVLGIVLVGLVVVPVVGAASPSPAATAPAATPMSFERGVARHALLAGTVRADLTVVKRDGTTVLVHYEAGEITAVSATSITIRGRDGKGASFVVTAETRVRAAGRRISIADLEVGDRAMVFGTNSSGTYTAVVIRRVRPAPAAAG